MAGKNTSKTTESMKAAKQAKKTRPKGTKADAGKKLSALNAAAKVPAETGEGMGCQELIERMAKKEYWASPGGKTPHATLNAAIAREIKIKGKDSRFVKSERGKFARA